MIHIVQYFYSAKILRSKQFGDGNPYSNECGKRKESWEKQSLKSNLGLVTFWEPSFMVTLCPQQMLHRNDDNDDGGDDDKVAWVFVRLNSWKTTFQYTW